MNRGAGLNRREFSFRICAVAGGLLAPAIHAAAKARDSTPPNSPEVTAWLTIAQDDTVFIRVARSDMGQGIFTSLPMLVAEELECEWSRVKPEYAPVSEHLRRGRVWGSMVTTDSISVRGSQDYLRKAGAQARTMLISEAASRWGCPPQECAARDSVVKHLPTGRTLRFGVLAQAAGRRAVPSEVSLKPPEAWRLIGKSLPQFEMLAKVSGKLVYAIDVQLPGMLHAAVKACPSHGGKLIQFEREKVDGFPGVRQVLAIEGNAVAVIADTWWQAKLALDALPVKWDESPGSSLSSTEITKSLQQGLDAVDAVIGRRAGNVDAVLAQAAKRISSDFLVPYLAHATMEPQTCTAVVTAGSAEVWAPTQNGEGTQATVAAALRMDPSQVTVHKCHLGGGFGRRGLSQDWARQAVLIAKAAQGRPVKLIWSRQEDMTQDFYRPLVVARQTAGFDSDGRLLAWKVRLCGASIASRLAPQWLRNGQDVGMMNGYLERDMVYAVPNIEVGAVMRNNLIPVGFWRGVNYSQNNFFREAFIDEMAEAAGKDPYQFRRSLLANSPRSLAVLDEAASRAGWGTASAGIHRGIAVVEFDDAVCAQVVELSVGPDGSVIVHRVVCAVDCGFVVHPDTVIAQMEGSIVQGLGAVLTGEITVDGGRVQQSNFHDYPLLRIQETPKIETWLISSGEKYVSRWGGIGETGLPPLAPAFVNAVFAATGQRIRSLPLKNHKLSRSGS